MAESVEDRLRREIIESRTRLQHEVFQRRDKILPSGLKTFIDDINDELNRIEQRIDIPYVDLGSYELNSRAEAERVREFRQMILDSRTLSTDVDEAIQSLQLLDHMAVGAGFGNYVVPDALNPSTIIPLQRRFF